MGGMNKLISSITFQLYLLFAFSIPISFIINTGTLLSIHIKSSSILNTISAILYLFLNYKAVREVSKFQLCNQQFKVPSGLRGEQFWSLPSKVKMKLKNSRTRGARPEMFIKQPDNYIICLFVWGIVYH